MNEDETIKKQEEYDEKEGLFASAIFKDDFLQKLDELTKEATQKESENLQYLFAEFSKAFGKGNFKNGINRNVLLIAGVKLAVIGAMGAGTVNPNNLTWIPFGKS